jgi:hypothetical protein
MATKSKKSLARKTQFNVRCNDQEYASWKTAAARDHRSLSEWSRLMLNQAADNVVKR